MELYEQYSQKYHKAYPYFGFALYCITILLCKDKMLFFKSLFILKIAQMIYIDITFARKYGIDNMRNSLNSRTTNYEIMPDVNINIRSISLRRRVLYALYYDYI